MTLTELFIIAVGLSMDAFAAAVCQGVTANGTVWKKAVVTGAFFGGFQALMPLMGYILGAQFEEKIAAFDHWIAFILLSMIGVNMIREAFSKESGDKEPLNLRTLIALSVATSIDAFAVGVTFAFFQVKIISAVSLIGCVTFLLSAAGLYLGSMAGQKYRFGAELSGGAVLVIMGIKMLVQGLRP